MTPAEFVAARKRIGWSRKELAERMGVSYEAVRWYERGPRTVAYPVASWLCQVAEFLERHRCPCEPGGRPRAR